MSIFRKGGLRAFGRNLFRKQATGINKIFSKISEGANFLQDDRIKAVVNSPVLDALASKYGGTGVLAGVRAGYGKLGQVKQLADVGAELGSIALDVDKKGVNENTIERGVKAGQKLATL